MTRTQLTNIAHATLDILRCEMRAAGLRAAFQPLHSAWGVEAAVIVDDLAASVGVSAHALTDAVLAITSGAPALPRVLAPLAGSPVAVAA